jgi:O-antigen/teichoic acid export membrane protein
MADDVVATETRRGISWNLVSALVVNLARVAVLLILGRNLIDEDFGLVASAVAVNVIIASLRDLGMGIALVQRKELRPQHLTTAFAVSVSIGTAATTGLMLAAPLIANAYKMPALENVVRGLAPLFFIGGLSVVSRSVCQRSLQFRAIAVIDTLAFLVGAAVSIGLAITHHGPWALIVGYLVEELLGTLAYLAISPPKVSLRIDRTCFHDLMSFGGWQIVSSIAGNLAVNADNAVVGRQLGSGALGTYARAYDLMKFPSQVFTAIVGNVLFPSFSRMQDDRPRMAAAFRRGLLVNGLVLMPGSAFLIIAAPEIIHVLMGSRWAGAVLPFQILTVSMLFRTSQKLAILVVSAVGQIKIVALLNVAYMSLVFFSALITVRWGIAAVSVSTGVAIVAMTLATAGFANRVSGITWRGIVAAHVPGAVATVVVAATCSPCAQAIRSYHVAAIVLIISVGLIAVVSSASAVVVARRWFQDDWQWMVTHLWKRSSADK